MAGVLVSYTFERHSANYPESEVPTTLLNRSIAADPLATVKSIEQI